MKILLFDIDGTLVSTGGAGRKAFVQALGAGFEVEAEFDDVPFAGQTDPLILREFFVRHGIELSQRNVNIFFENYLRFLQKNMFALDGKVMPGILEILERCGNGGEFRAGLLTGNIEAGAKVKLERFDLWRHFEFGAFASDHEERDEIARVAWRRSRERFGEELRPEDLVVIGDTPKDVRCGKEIGAWTVAVATGPHSVKELEGCGADIVLRDLGHVKKFLDWCQRG